MKTVYVVEYHESGGPWRTCSMHATKKGAYEKMKAESERYRLLCDKGLYWAVITWKVQK